MFHPGKPPGDEEEIRYVRGIAGLCQGLSWASQAHLESSGRKLETDNKVNLRRREYLLHSPTLVKDRKRNTLIRADVGNCQGFNRKKPQKRDQENKEGR